MKKKTKLFKHFITILNILACSVPLIAFAIVTLQDVLPKYFTSLGMQHHGDGSSTFDDDLNALTDSNQFKDMNYHMLNTLDRLDYFNYDITGYRQVQYQTNEVNSIDDLIVGNVYQLNINVTQSSNSFYLNIGKVSNFYIYELSSFLDSNLNNLDIIIKTQTISINNDVFLYIGTFVNNYTMPNNINLELGTYRNLLTNTLHIKYIAQTTNTNILQFISKVTDDFNLNQFDLVEGYDNFDDFIDYQNNRSYTDIIQDTDTHLPLNIDFISLFTQSEIVNRNGNVAIYLFINYYMNYLINILIILFLPELTIIFFFMLKNLTYKLIDKEI